MENKISGLILAAGQGKRAGYAKLSRMIGDKPMLEHVAEKAVKSDLSEIIVVTGFERDFAEQIAKKYGFKTCHNSNYEKGMSTSLKKGVQVLSDDCLGFAVILGDMPYIKTSTIDALITAYLDCQKGFVIPTYQNRRGHPTIISTKYRQEILEIYGDKGARDVIGANIEDVLFLEVDEVGILKDVDTFPNRQ
jgi:molybdenum cofactor cytidylyltransferase